MFPFQSFLVFYARLVPFSRIFPESVLVLLIPMRFPDEVEFEETSAMGGSNDARTKNPRIQRDDRRRSARSHAYATFSPGSGRTLTNENARTNQVIDHLSLLFLLLPFFFSPSSESPAHQTRDLAMSILTRSTIRTARVARINPVQARDMHFENVVGKVSPPLSHKRKKADCVMWGRRCRSA